jgi:type I restriction enzyme, R subunit
MTACSGTTTATSSISTAQVIEELIGLAKTITTAIEEGRETGLSEEEVAFYQALAAHHRLHRA